MKGTRVRLTNKRTDLGVAMTDTTANVLTSIMTVTVPAGLAYVLLNHTPFVFWVTAATADTKILSRVGYVIIGFKGAGDTLVKELYRWDFGNFWDLTIVQQRSRDYLSQVQLNMPYDYVIAREDEQLILQFLNAEACVVATAGNVIEFDVQRVILA